MLDQFAAVTTQLLSAESTANALQHCTIVSTQLLFADIAVIADAVSSVRAICRLIDTTWDDY